MHIVIDRFTGPFACLSNHYPAAVDYRGVSYPTVTHALAAARLAGYELQRVIHHLPDPQLAMTVSEQVPAPEDWDSQRIDLLDNLLWQKFTRYPDMGERLLSTVGMHLGEGDTGHVLMGVRARLFVGKTCLYEGG